jgi:hypothetical protein
MCGRYYRRSDKQRIADAFHLGKLPEGFVLPPADYNIAPTTFQPVIRAHKESGEREPVTMQWGIRWIQGWVTSGTMNWACVRRTSARRTPLERCSIRIGTEKGRLLGMRSFCPFLRRFRAACVFSIVAFWVTSAGTPAANAAGLLAAAWVGSTGLTKAISAQNAQPPVLPVLFPWHPPGH